MKYKALIRTNMPYERGGSYYLNEESARSHYSMYGFLLDTITKRVGMRIILNRTNEL